MDDDPRIPHDPPGNRTQALRPPIRGWRAALGGCGCALLILDLALAVVSVCLWQLLGTFTPTPVAFLFYAVLTGMGVSAVVAALRRPGAARASVRRPGPEAPRPWMP